MHIKNIQGALPPLRHITPDLTHGLAFQSAGLMGTDRSAHPSKTPGLYSPFIIL